MVDLRRPRHGSLAFRPRKRASSENVRLSWQSLDQKRIIGFAGYKAGMTHVTMIDDSNSPTKGKEIVVPVSVIEVPGMHVYGIRYYKSGKSVADIYVKDEKILKKLNIRKKKEAGSSKPPEDYDSLRLLVYLDPSETTFGKKHIERMEIGLGGNKDEQKELAESYLGKKISVKDVFKPGEYLDISGVTKGKGWQGPVKRFGVKIQRPKATGRRRHVGTLGEWHPAYVQYSTPQAGQMGYHTRTEVNKRILYVGSASEVNKIMGYYGFPGYKTIKNDFILIKGSVPGVVKRMVKMRLGVRAPKEIKTPEVTNIAKR